MSKKELFLLLIPFVSFTVKGQKRNNVCVFGNHAGINFNTIPPTALDSTSVTNKDPYPTPHFLNNYYTASICDTSGNLLFYTDGVKVWDKRNNIIPRYLARWHGLYIPCHLFVLIPVMIPCIIF